MPDEKLSKARKALFESEQRYQSLVDSIPDTVFTLNESGEFLAVNNEFTSALGYSSEEVQGVAFTDIVDPEDVDQLTRALKEVVEQKSVVKGLECRIRSKDGKIKHFELNQKGVYGVDNELLYIEGVAHDISERRKVEEKIRYLKEFSETIFNTIRSGIVVVDAKTYRIISANSAFLKQVDLSEEQVSGRNYYEISHTSHQAGESDGSLSILDLTVQSGEPYEADRIRVDGDGKRRFIEVSSHPIKNEKNEVTQVILIERDVTERKRIEEELKKRVNELSILKEVSEALLQSALKLEEIAYIALVGVTAGQGLSFNRAFLLLLNDQEGVLEGMLAIGPSSPEEAGRIWSDLNQQQLSFSGLLKNCSQRDMCHDVAVNQIVKKVRISVTNKNILIKALMEGKAFNVKGGVASDEPDEKVDDWLTSLLGVDSFAIVPLYSRSKRIGVIIADNMITKLPITDANIDSLRIFANYASSAIENSRLYRELEVKVKDLQKANDLIREKQEELLEAERLSTIGRMAAVLAHEIRNPLVSIGGFARSIVNEIPPQDPKREELSIIVSETMRLEELVKSVLEYAKFAKPKPKPLDLNDLIRRVANLVKYELKTYDVNLRLELSEPLPQILADDNQIRQVLLNLIFNAIHAMPHGGNITIATSSDEAAIELKVADTGCGIPEEYLDKVFAPFFTTKTQGSGIGLHLVFQIVTEHGGKIHVNSKKNEGTTFIINLPFKGEARYENHTHSR